MAAHFNLKLYNFEKEGKGVEKDEKKPVAFLRVFILYFRNFWKMTLFNLTRFGAVIPLAAVAVSAVVIMMGEEAINSFIMTDDFQTFNQTYPWVMIFVNIYHFFTGSTITPERCSIFEDNVTVPRAVGMVTKTTQARLNAPYLDNLQSESTSCWLFPTILFWYKSIQVSGNALR